MFLFCFSFHWFTTVPSPAFPFPIYPTFLLPSTSLPYSLHSSLYSSFPLNLPFSLSTFPFPSYSPLFPPYLSLSLPISFPTYPLPSLPSLCLPPSTPFLPFRFYPFHYCFLPFFLLFSTSFSFSFPLSFSFPPLGSLISSPSVQERILYTCLRKTFYQWWNQ